MYRSDAAFSADSDAWKRAGEGLLKIGGEGERRTVQFVALEPRTLPPLAEHFTKLLVESAQRPPKAATETPKNK